MTNRFWKRIITGMLTVSLVMGTVLAQSMFAQNLTVSEKEAEEVSAQTEEELLDGCADAINYLLIESPYVESPGTQRIFLSYGDGTEEAMLSLAVTGPDGEREEWAMSQQEDGLYVASRTFAQSEGGVYTIDCILVTDEAGTQTLLLSDYGMDAVFGVDTEYEGYEDLEILGGDEEQLELTVVSLDETLDEDAAAERILEALTAAEEELDAEEVAVSKTVAGVDQLIHALDAVFTVSAQAASDSAIVVAIDPGHDDTHAGAVSASGLKEADLNLKIAQYCKAELETYAGVSVYMTRTTSACPYPSSTSSAEDIKCRIAAAVAAGASIYVSLHLNSSTSTSTKGAEIIIPNSNWKPTVAEEAEALAEAIIAQLEAAGVTLRSNYIYSRDTSISETYDDGSAADYYTNHIETKKAGIPGIIVEHCFMSNTGDVSSFLSTEDGLKSLGVADATGIANYLGLTKSSSTTTTTTSTTTTTTTGTSTTTTSSTTTSTTTTTTSTVTTLSTPTLSAATTTSTGTKISWSAVTGAAGYLVFRKASGGSWSALAYTTSTSYTDTSTRTAGTTYYYTVRAYRGSQTVAKANKYSSTYWSGYDSTGAVAVYLATPTLTTKTTNTTTGIKVSWSSVSAASGYAVLRKTAGGSWTQIGVTTSTSYTDTTAVAGTTYYYSVRAYKGSQATALSNTYKAAYWSYYNTTGVSGRFLAAPTLKSATASSSGVTVKWSSVTNASGYVVYRKVSGGSWTKIGVTTSTSYKDKDTLSASKTYYYTVRAYRGSYTTADANKYLSTYWSSYTSSGISTVALSTPTLSKTTAAATGIKVSWSSVSGAAGYAVYRKVSGGSWSMLGTTTSTSYTDKTAATGTTYYYTVRAYRGSLSTAKANKYSSIYWSGYDATGITGRYLPTPALTSATVDNTGIKVSWSSVSGATGYVIYRKESGGSWTQYATTTSTSYIDTEGGSAGTTYYYTVRAYRGSLSTATSNKYKSQYWSYYDTAGVSCSAYSIEGDSTVTIAQMVAYFNAAGYTYPTATYASGGASTITALARIYYEEAQAEGIRVEVAWCQMMIETGYLQFGGTVQASQYNFAGLGAVDGSSSGATFSSVREGVRAHIQHLKAYASADITSSTLAYTCVDPRFVYVTKGSAKYVEILGTQENPLGYGWATASGYGSKILTHIAKLKSY